MLAIQGRQPTGLMPARRQEQFPDLHVLAFVYDHAEDVPHLSLL
jgi:hypothetical protein